MDFIFYDFLFIFKILYEDLLLFFLFIDNVDVFFKSKECIICINMYKMIKV